MPKKIVHLTPYYWPHVGGVETHLAELNKVFTKKGNQITVITEQFDRALPRYEVHDGVEIYRFPTVSKAKRSKNIFYKVLYKLSVFKNMWGYNKHFHTANIIHCHDVLWWLLPFYPFVKSKMFVTFHGWEGIFPIPVKIKLQRRFYSTLARGVLHVGSWIKTFYGDTPNTVTYGAAPQNIPPLKIKRNEYGMKHAPYTFVFVGRLEEVNGIPKYIELIKQLTTTTYKPRVLWVGDGKYREHCKKVGKVIGFKNDISEYIQRGKIVLASSYLSIFEAQAHGKIVAAFYSHPLKEAYLKTFPGIKYMVVAEKVEQMKRKLEVPLYSDQATLYKKGKIIQEFSKTQTWEKVAEEYEWLWQL